jgi:hypothetical protein
MPSNDEINAAFDAIQPYIRQLVVQFVPGMFEGQALQALASQEGRRDIVNGLTKALTAAEGVRAKAVAKVAPKP